MKTTTHDLYIYKNCTNNVKWNLSHICSMPGVRLTLVTDQ